MKKDSKNKNEIIIYQALNKKIEVNLYKESIWLDAHKIANIFGVDRSGIVRHINNIYKSNELSRVSTCAKNAQVAKDGKVRKMDIYNLDVIISVGYRVNSKRATQFRIWATNILKKYLVEGYVINKKRLLETNNKLKDVQQAIKFLSKKHKTELLEGQESEILDLISDYSKTLTLLEQYDNDKITKIKGKKSRYIINYEKSISIIKQIKKGRQKDLFGKEYRGKFEGIIKGIYQTYAGKDLYSTLEQKAANLLYLIIKDHPFADGNKRIGAFLFIYFLDKNNYLYKKDGEKKINDNALVTLALLIALSQPKEKDLLVGIVTSLITE